jgi:hypothetical protein
MGRSRQTSSSTVPVEGGATIVAVLEAVRAAPPPAFSGGGKWEAMHASSGFYEIRVIGRPQVLPAVLSARQRNPR